MFPGVKALDDVSFDAKSGEILGLVGQNGAGKSTVIQIVSGAYQKDFGTIYVDEKPVEIAIPRDAIDAGIAVVYQKLQLIDTMTAAENICLYKRLEETYKTVPYGEIDRMAQEVLDSINVSMDIHTLVKDLSPGMRQFVEIAKALSTGAKILILDEPTASLNEDEVEHLFVVLRHLREQGTAIVYVSHRFDEIFQLTDRITVLRNGKLVDTVNTKDITPKELVTMVVGKSLSGQFPDRVEKELGEPVLEFKSVSSAWTERIHDVSFQVRKGEIYGVYGLEYSGLQEIANILAGDVSPAVGRVFVSGKEVKFAGPSDAIAHGIAYLSNDRLVKGAFAILPLRENLTVSSIKKYVTSGGVVRQGQESEQAKKLVERLDIMTTSVEKQMQFLSGGNQQKALVGRLLDTDAKILVMHEPTHGIDVGSKHQMYRIMLELGQLGYTIVFITTEHEEILSLADRVLVLNKGKVQKEAAAQEMDLEELHSLASL